MQNKLKRDLKARHLTMIAIGGSIGTGLFLGSGAVIATAGPAGALFTYALIGIMVYFLMTSLGELASFLPVSGTFATYGARYVDPSFGFAVGWNYWYNWAITVAADIAAAQLVISYFWDIGAYSWLWSVLFICVVFLLNSISVKGFGEAEFWFAIIKVITVIVFICVGMLMILGILKGAPAAGWDNWKIGDGPFHGGFWSIIGIAMIVGYSFQGTELIGIAAGESKDPEKNIPKSMKQVFWRILFFYILAILVISLIVPYTDPNLGDTGISNIAISPFTLVFKNAGLLSAAVLMNAVILTALLSASNSGLYASTRMLYALAKEGKAPKMFSQLSKNGVPFYALVATTLVAILCLFVAIMSEEHLFFWLANLSGMTGFIAWIGIAISHYRFRRGYVKRGLDLNAIPYQAKLFPFGPIFAFIICIIVVLSQDIQGFVDGSINWTNAFATYVGIPLFLIIMLVHKIVKKTKWVKYSEMDFSRIKIE